MFLEIWIWVAVIIAASVIELLTTQLACIWFAGGGLAAVVAYFLGAGVEVQVIAAAAVTLVLLIATRPFVRKLLSNEPTPTNSDRVIGQTGIVVEEIDNSAEKGRIVVFGADWRALSLDNRSITVGKAVRVEKLEGVKLFVSEI